MAQASTETGANLLYVDCNAIAPQTVRQIETIKEEFIRVLVGMYHNRIDYPTASGGVTSEFASV